MFAILQAVFSYEKEIDIHVMHKIHIFPNKFCPLL